MECAEIKKIIPQYFQHTASEEEIQAVEEHLCVCHDCRTILGELMDKASSGEEAAETPSPEQPQEKVEENTKKRPEGVPPKAGEEEISAPEAKEVEANQPEQVPRSEGKEDRKYFPGEGLEASMDKVDEILGGVGPVKGESEEEPQELKPTLEDKEDSSFEVITDIPSAHKQELPAESDIETLGGKEPEPVKEEIKEPEEKLEIPSEEKEEKPEIPWESGLKLKEKKPEEPVKEIKEPQAEPKKEEEQPKQSSEDSEGEKESSEEVPYILDKSPLEKVKIGFLECFCLIGSLAVLGFLAYLFLKG